MINSLVHSLLHLGHATSGNLEFAHRDDVHVSYGEETITETNLLELRRRHPHRIQLRTFCKKDEALNGADWEWHILGRARRFSMRVQAKRLQKDGVLKVHHRVKSSGRLQLDLLIEDAQKHKLKPVYCLYAPASRQKRWKEPSPWPGFKPFEHGCLLASAYKVRSNEPSALDEIENHCVPWHFLAQRHAFYRMERATRLRLGTDGSTFSFLAMSLDVAPLLIGSEMADGSSEFPDLAELNDPDDDGAGREGVSADYLPFDLSAADYLERGIIGMITIDARGLLPIELGVQRRGE